ncbi:hypothetical protein BD769DRAFT_1782802 [Suillus cothurnatus]|nr:hypothetical protein BD769DRAFT_1782802 [Suillus cothurnatus]
MPVHLDQAVVEQNGRVLLKGRPVIQHHLAITLVSHLANDGVKSVAAAIVIQISAMHPAGGINLVQLLTRLQYQGNSQDLDKSIRFHREALALQLAGCPDNGPFTRFRHCGNVQDLDESIALRIHTSSSSLPFCAQCAGECLGQPSITKTIKPLATAFLRDLALSEMDDEIDLDDERDWVDQASDAFFASLVFMGR